MHRLGTLEKLRFLLYPANLTEEDRQRVKIQMAGVKWLEEAKKAAD